MNSFIPFPFLLQCSDGMVAYTLGWMLIGSPHAAFRSQFLAMVFAHLFVQLQHLHIPARHVVGNHCSDGFTGCKVEVANYRQDGRALEFCLVYVAAMVIELIA